MAQLDSGLGLLPRPFPALVPGLMAGQPRRRRFLARRELPACSRLASGQSPVDFCCSPTALRHLRW